MDDWVVDAIGAPHVGERTEKQLITAFCDKIAELSPQLITFNGNSFDLPVLRYRPYFNRYTEDAIDLCEQLGVSVSSVVRFLVSQSNLPS
jgi:predicted PolB exonuclease-like 3'-5' exonuclease